jgi:hypothetical protein
MLYVAEGEGGVEGGRCEKEEQSVSSDSKHGTDGSVPAEGDGKHGEAHVLNRLATPLVDEEEGAGGEARDQLRGE